MCFYVQVVRANNFKAFLHSLYDYYAIYNIIHHFPSSPSVIFLKEEIIEPFMISSTCVRLAKFIFGLQFGKFISIQLKLQSSITRILIMEPTRSYLPVHHPIKTIENIYKSLENSDNEEILFASSLKRYLHSPYITVLRSPKSPLRHSASFRVPPSLVFNNKTKLRSPFLVVPRPVSITLHVLPFLSRESKDFYIFQRRFFIIPSVFFFFFSRFCPVLGDPSREIIVTEISSACSHRGISPRESSY